jgi:hypothetical protein
MVVQQTKPITCLNFIEKSRSISSLFVIMVCEKHNFFCQDSFNVELAPNQSLQEDILAPAIAKTRILEI